MPEGLKIQVGADVQQAVKALSQDVPKAADKAGDSFQKLGATVEKSSVTFNRTLPQSFTKSKAAVLQLQAPLSKLGDTLETLKAKIGARQSFLNIEKDPAKVAALNREISLLNAEVFRVGNIGKQGFDALGNAISKVPPQLATVASGAGKTFSILRQAAFILPGIGIAGLIGGLSDLVVGLFETGNAFSQADVFAGQFNNRIKAIKESVDSLKSALEFEGKIKKLSLELSGLSGSNLSIGKAGVDIAQSSKLLPELDTRIKQLSESNKNLVSGFLKTNEVLGKFGSGSQLVNLVRQFGSIENIPSSLGDKLNKADKELLRQYQETNNELKSLQKQRIETIQGIGLTGVGILVDVQKEATDKIKENADKQKEINQQAAADYQKYVSDIIAEAKRVNDAFKGGIDLQLKSGFFDTNAETFKKSLNFLKDFNAGNFKFIFRPDISIEPPPEAVGTTITKFGDLMQDEINNYFSQPGNKLDISLILAVQDENDRLKKLEELKKKIQEFSPIANQIGNSFAEAFGQIAQGENAFKSIGEAVKQLGIDLIKTAIRAFITKAILGALTGGASNAVGGLGSLLGRVPKFAKGGLAFGPTLGLVGEGAGTTRSNPEVIAPLDKLKGMLAGMGGGATQRVVVTGRLRGNDMVLQNARTSRYQNRTTGR